MLINSFQWMYCFDGVCFDVSLVSTGSADILQMLILARRWYFTVFLPNVWIWLHSILFLAAFVWLLVVFVNNLFWTAETITNIRTLHLCPHQFKFPAHEAATADRTQWSTQSHV